MTDVTNQLNDIEVPLTAQSKAQRKRHDEVTSLIGTDMTGLAKQLMDVDIALASHSDAESRKRHDSATKEINRKRQHALEDLHIDLAPDHERSTIVQELEQLDSPPSLLSPLALHLWISDDEDDERTPDEEDAFLTIAVRELEETRASSRAKKSKKRNYGRVGSSGGIAKLVIHGGRPGKVRDDSKAHADRQASKVPKEADRNQPAHIEPVVDLDREELEYSAEQQRRELWRGRRYSASSHWSTKAVANFGGDENDKYACFK